jgi:hypothetical protein
LNVLTAIGYWHDDRKKEGGVSMLPRTKTFLGQSIFLCSD